MVEVVYRKEDGIQFEGERFKLPKNIKQVGGGKPDIQVYIEETAYVYLNKFPDEEMSIRYGVLLGNVKRSCGYTYIFIYGVADVREIYDNTVLFGDDIWKELNEDAKRFYQGQRIIGWFLSEYVENTGSNTWINKMHLNNFAGNDKVFYRINREESEDGFYYYKDGIMDKLSCYHIFYEKNKQMTDYILDGGMSEKLKNYIPEPKLEIREEKLPPKKEEIKKQVNIKWVVQMGMIAVFGVFAVSYINNGKIKDNVKTAISAIMDTGEDLAIEVNGAVESRESDIPETTENESLNQETTQPTTEETTQPPVEEYTQNPVSVKETKTYIVEKGDTLYSICEKLYGNTDKIKEIIRMNDLSTENAIYYGEKLIVPR